MRFAIKTRPEHTTWAEIRDVAVAADEIDLFESWWDWDHFYPLSGDLTGPNLEGWTMIAALAQATRRIRLPPLKERFDRFDEGVEVIARLLSQTTTSFDGRYVRLTDARCEPKPVQRPHPPITIGGRGRTRTLRTAARWAAQWNAITDSPEMWRDLKDTLVAHCDDIGRDPKEITCSVNVRIAPEKGIEPAVEEASRYRDAGADLVIMNLPHRASPGILTTLAEQLRPLV